MKKINLLENNVGGYDLDIERDAGNEVRILTGNSKASLEFWKRLRNISEDAISEIQAIIEIEKDNA